MAVLLTARQRRERVALINRLYEAHPERGYLAAITDGAAAYRGVVNSGQRASPAGRAQAGASASRRVLKEIRRAVRRAVLESGALTAAQVPLPPSAPAGRKADRGGTADGSTDLTQMGDEELAVRFDLVAGAAHDLDSPFWGDARG